MTNRKTIGDRISSLLKERHISQRTLANGTEIPPSTLNEIISGKKEPAVSKVVRIAEFLEVDVHWLTTGTAFEQLTPTTNVVAEEDGQAQYIAGNKTQHAKLNRIFKSLQNLDDEELQIIDNLISKLKSK